MPGMKSDPRSPTPSCNEYQRAWQGAREDGACSLRTLTIPDEGDIDARHKT